MSVTIIKPTAGWASLRLQDIWEYRELLYFLAWREVKVRYKQTVIGAAWAVIQPLFTMLIFSLFFGRLGKMPSDGVPYPLFCLAALVPWTFFSNGLVQSANSLVSSVNLITKVYFPRLAIPISAVLSGTLDRVIALGLLLAIMLYYGRFPNANIFWVPALLLLTVATSLGVGMWLSALNVEYRDVRHIVPFLTQFWMFATPIAYPSSLLKGPWRMVFAINPMVGVVEGFRWALFGVGTAPGCMVAVSSFVAVALLVSGSFYFRRMERYFADRV